MLAALLRVQLVELGALAPLGIIAPLRQQLQRCVLMGHTEMLSLENKSPTALLAHLAVTVDPKDWQMFPDHVLQDTIVYWVMSHLLQQVFILELFHSIG